MHAALFCNGQILIIVLVALICNLQGSLGSKFPPLDSLVPQVSPTVQKSNVQQFLGRLFDWNAGLINQFDIDIIDNTDLDHDWFTVKKSSILHPKPVIEIKATSGVTASKAIHTYLRQYTNSHFSWDGNVLNIPSVLPPVTTEISQASIGRFRYFGNVCTFSYSMVWWKWADWEQFIDWMALNGINLPLSHVGAESVWQRVWRQFGLTQQQIDDYFTGPAFLAWFRMGNLYRWGGPLTQAWHDEQELLQKRIIQRMTGLGMVPVLQGFDGHVPPAIITKYPQANITRHSCWVVQMGLNYTCLPYVQPNDPLFQNIAHVYMQELERTYGFYHAYTADPFNEMPPFSMDKSYLQEVGSNILKGMTNTDPKAIWVMMGWMFVGGGWDHSAKYLLQSVPKGQMLVLDLYSERVPIYNRFDSYFGQPFVWNFLHNFGGFNVMYGSFAQGNEGLKTAVSFPNSTIVGTGLTMEGIYQNYALYQFMLDRFWSADMLDLNKWLERYATERYSNISTETSIQNLIEAWKILADTVYNNVGVVHLSDPRYPSQLISSKSIEIKDQAVPASFKFQFKRPRLNAVCTAPFNTTEFVYAEAAFIAAAVQIGYQTMMQNKPFLRDYLDIIAAALNIHNCKLYQNITQAYQRKNATVLTALGHEFMQNLLFLDSVYKDLNETQLQWWLQTAASKVFGLKGAVGSESRQYRTNWRYQLTLWGPNGQILDYAAKQWSGLLKDYYVPRWSLFIQFLLKSIKNGQPYSQKQFDYAVNSTVETPFCHRN